MLCYCYALFCCCLFCFLGFFFSPLHGLWGLCSQARGWAWAPVVGVLSPSCWNNRVLQAPGNINRCELSQRSSSWHQDLAPPNCLQTPGLDTSDQTTSKTRTQPHPSTKMRWQRNMLQTKEKGKNLQDQINEKEIGNLPEKRIQSNDSKDDSRSRK